MPFYAFQILQRGTEIYIATLSARDLIDNSDVYTWKEERRDGYQRELRKAAISKLREYLKEGGSFLPTSLLVSVDDIRIVQEVETINDFIKLVKIEPIGTMWIVDGQRRRKSLEELFSDSELGWTFQNFPLPICLFRSQNRLREMEQFYVVNTRQESVPTVLAQQLLFEEYSESPSAFFDFMKRIRATEKEALSGLAVRIVRYLRNYDPWRNCIQPPNELRRGAYIISQRAMAEYIGRFVLKNDQDFMDAYEQLKGEPNNTEYRQSVANRLDDLAVNLKNYWKAFKTLFRTAFTNPREYSIQGSTGVYVFHRIFSGDYPQAVWNEVTQNQPMVGVYDHCERNGDFTMTRMGKVLNHMFTEATNRREFEGRSVDDKFWHKGRRGVLGRGHKLAVATTAREMNLLSVKLGRHLPPLP